MIKRKTCEPYEGIIFGQKFEIRDDFDDVPRRWLLALAEIREKSQGFAIHNFWMQGLTVNVCAFFWKIALKIIWQSNYNHLVYLEPQSKAKYRNLKTREKLPVQAPLSVFQIRNALDLFTQNTAKTFEKLSRKKMTDLTCYYHKIVSSMKEGNFQTHTTVPS